VLDSAFAKNSIAIETNRLNWLAALEKAVGLLEASGRTTDQYLEQVMAQNAALGPYFVVAPGIAIAHAAPSKAVLETGLALLKLEKPVASGSANDPVSLLFAFCSVDAETHISLLGDFAELMSTPGKINSLLNASAVGEIRKILGQGGVG
jgi:mannitol/fructose-specific phosphotransferase system IIA component (Ntr-type)